MCFHRRVKFEALCVPRVNIRRMQVEELIRFVKRLDLHDGAVCHLCGRQFPRAHIQEIVPAQRPAADTVACPHRRGGIVAEIRHALGKRFEIERDLVAVAFVEDLRMLRIAPRLDDGERRIGAFGRGEVLVEDHAARKEARDVRHTVGEPRAGDVP